LVATRSSPQLILKQIHEEAEEGAQVKASAAASSPSARGPTRVTSCPVGPSASEAEAEVDPVDSFPSSAAGMAVIRRLEQRRRMHKARTQSSCSSASSDASDDDAESRGSNEKKSRTPPLPSARPCKRDSQHDDSSDSQEPGMGASGTAFRGTSSFSTTTATAPSGGGNGSESTEGNSGGSGADGTKRSANAGLGTRRHRALHGHQSRRAPRIRQSHSLNRISELHVVADFFSDNCSADADLDDVSNNNSSCPSSSVASVSNGMYGAKPMLPNLVGVSEGDSEKSAHFDMLSRYLDSLSANRSYHLSNTNGSNRSREDSQNSSDGEFEASESRHMHKRKHKVNLRVLEQRLNKIQEECNKSADEEEGEVDEDAGEISDDPSTIPDDPESRQELATENAVNALTFVGAITEQPGEANDDIDAPKNIMEIYEQSRREYQWRAPPPFHCDDLDDRASTRSCDVVAARRGGRNRNSSSGGGRFHHARGESNAKPKKPLARAHSCGSLLSLRERTLLKRNLPVLYDILKVTTAAVTAESAKDPSTKQQQQQITLNLAAAAAVVGNPLAVFQLNHVSRCCSLC
jgi:hypothetical protein